ncbi:hypothetical protein CRUP_032231, partial [Coryphaenoides rupestris]
MEVEVEVRMVVVEVEVEVVEEVELVGVGDKAVWIQVHMVAVWGSEDLVMPANYLPWNLWQCHLWNLWQCHQWNLWQCHQWNLWECHLEQRVGNRKRKSQDEMCEAPVNQGTEVGGVSINQAHLCP